LNFDSSLSDFLRPEHRCCRYRVQQHTASSHQFQAVNMLAFIQ
jgi:hypothetical protein